MSSSKPLMTDKQWEWMRRFADIQVETGRLLDEARADGVIPKIVVHKSRKFQRLAGKHAQRVEFSVVLGRIIPKNRG